MRRVLLLLALILAAGCLSQSESIKQGTSPEEIITGPPKLGEIVTIDYVMKADGELFDTTLEEAADESPDKELIDTLHPLGYEPMTFILGSGHVNPEFTAALETMMVGERKTFSISPEDSNSGMWRPELVQVMTRSAEFPAEETVPRTLFEGSFGVTPEIGKEVSFDYWNSTVVALDSENVTLRHRPQDSLIEVYGGEMSVEIIDETLTMKFIPRVNQTFQTRDGSYIRVLSVNETHMTVDYNHPLAGKTLEVEVILNRISKPINWETDVEKAVKTSEEEGKAVFVLFTNVTCVDCRRIMFETLSHPFPLALKDEFTWVSMDVDIQKEAAQKYGADALPLIIILKDGKEIKRITEFIPPQLMRLEMQSALAEN